MDLIEKLRREADISARPGQMDRLNALADEFAAALEAAREDGARLDWLAEGFRTCTVYMSGSHAWFPGHKVRSLHGPNFRAAIDQARGKGVAG